MESTTLSIAHLHPNISANSPNGIHSYSVGKWSYAVQLIGIAVINIMVYRAMRSVPDHNRYPFKTTKRLLLDNRHAINHGWIPLSFASDNCSGRPKRFYTLCNYSVLYVCSSCLHFWHALFDGYLENSTPRSCPQERATKPNESAVKKWQVFLRTVLLVLNSPEVNGMRAARTGRPIAYGQHNSSAHCSHSSRWTTWRCATLLQILLRFA